MALTKQKLKTMKKVKVIRIFHGKYHSGNIDEAREDFLSAIKSACGDKFDMSQFVESQNSFAYLNRVLLKSKINRETIGTVEFRSNDYIFRYEDNDGKIKESYGPKMSELELTDKGWIIKAHCGDLEYIILDEES